MTPCFFGLIRPDYKVFMPAIGFSRLRCFTRSSPQAEILPRDTKAAGSYPSRHVLPAARLRRSQRFKLAESVTLTSIFGIWRPYRPPRSCSLGRSGLPQRTPLSIALHGPAIEGNGANYALRIWANRGSHGYASPSGPAMLVTHAPERYLESIILQKNY